MEDVKPNKLATEKGKLQHKFYKRDVVVEKYTARFLLTFKVRWQQCQEFVTTPGKMATKSKKYKTVCPGTRGKRLGAKVPVIVKTKRAAPYTSEQQSKGLSGGGRRVLTPSFFFFFLNFFFCLKKNMQCLGKVPYQKGGCFVSKLKVSFTR